MLAWLKKLDRMFEPSTETVLAGMLAAQRLTGMPLFKQGQCPFGTHILKHGMAVRQFHSTRHDN